MKNRGVAIHFVIYDILPIRHPEWWPEGGGSAHTQWLQSVVKVSDALHSISKAVADDVQDWIKNQPEFSLRNSEIKHCWFHLGADIQNSIPSSGIPESADYVLSVLTERPTFLTVGTLEPRKGHRQVLQAFSILWSQRVELTLVIVGKRGWLVDQLILEINAHPELNKKLFWLESISDEYLDKVYAAASCLIAASEGEGFGLPLIEAARHKKPIIARDIPVFREVAGENAFYFSGLEPDALVSALHEWLVIDKTSQALLSTAMPSLTWKQSAQNLLEGILS